jgi:elongation factor P
MILASQMRAGMAVRYEGQLFKVLNAEYRPGQGKMGGATHARLRNLATGTQWEHSFRADLKIEDVAVDKRPVEFLYADGAALTFMDPETFEQIEIGAAMAGPQAALLTAQMKVSIEFVEGTPVSVSFPDFMELRVADTAPPVHQQQDSTQKAATLENGAQVMVPQFIKNGDVIRVDVAAMKYMDRVRQPGK